MSAETDLLRRAAERVRREGTAPEALGSDFDNPRLLAVADLLDRAANDHDETPCPVMDAALAVARAYLGSES